MIGQYIGRLVSAYPDQIAMAQNAVDTLTPFAMIGAAIWSVWLLLLWIDRLIDRSEDRRIAKAREPHYRTADAAQIKRETAQLWQRWHDTLPPVQHTPKMPPCRPARVLESHHRPATHAQRRRQS